MTLTQKEMIDKWGRLLNIWKTLVQQAQREGVSHDHVNEIAGGGRRQNDLQWCNCEGRGAQ